MSLYNTLFGENKDTAIFLGMIEMEKKDFARFRDIWLNTEGDKILVLTKLGGENRQNYQKEINQIRKNKYYITDYDDCFDETYAYFEFNIDEKYKETCKEIAPKEKRLTLEEMFKQEVEQAQIPGTDAFERMDKIAKKIVDQIEEFEKDEKNKDKSGPTIKIIEL